MKNAKRSRPFLASLAVAAFVAVTGTADISRAGQDVPAEPYLHKSSDGTRGVRFSETALYDVEVWDLKANKRLSSITGLAGVVNAADISPDGKKVVTGERNGLVGLWDADTGKELKLIKGHTDQVHDVRFSANGTAIASGARDGTARTWDAETGEQLVQHQQKGGSYIDVVSFSPDGRYVLSAGNGWADLWDARSGAVISSTLVGPEDEGGFTTFAHISPDGKAILVTDDDKVTKTIPIKLPAE